MPTDSGDTSPHSARGEESKRSVTSLNAQLLAHGYSKRPLRLNALSDVDQVHVSAVICELLGASVSNLSNVDDLNARYRTLQYEHERLYKQAERNERAASRLETEVESWKAKAAEAERKAAAEEERAKAFKDDVARGRKALENMRVAAAQEAKRAQLKLDKVLGQLSRQVPACPPTFELLNPIPPGAIAPLAPGPLPLLEQSLHDLADLRESLQEETQALRNVVVSTANALREALASGEGAEPPRRLLHAEFFAHDATTSASTGRRAQQAASRTAHPAIADARMRALAAEVRAALTVGVSPVMRDGSGATEAEAEVAAARARAQRDREKEDADMRDRVKDLEVELAIARGREEESKKVIEEMARLNVGGGVPSTTDFEEARLREEVLRQKRVLDQEREALQAATVQLSEARLAFEAEQAAHQAQREADAATAAAAVAMTAARDKSVIQQESQESQESLQLQAGTLEPSAAPTAAPRTPPKQAAHKHHPSSPSPLSPHPSPAKRSPFAKPHLAGKRRGPRPSLSRMVLERQARARAGDEPVRSASGNRVLGESGKRGNGILTQRSRISSGSKNNGDESPQPLGARKASLEAAPTGQPRKSSLTASTAASLARSQRPQDTAPPRSAAAAARMWR